MRNKYKYWLPPQPELFLQICMVYQGYIKLTIVDSFFVNKASNNNGKKNFD